MFKEIILKSLLSIEFRPIALTRMMVDCQCCEWIRVNLHFWDTLILVFWWGSHGITQIYPKRAHRLLFCKWSPPNSSTAKWWAQAIYALSHQVPSKSCHDECVPYSCPTHGNLLNCALLYILLSASSHTDCNYDRYDICSIMFVGCCGTVWFGDVLGHWWQILIVHDYTMASWPWFRGYAFHAEKQRCPQCNLCALCQKRIVFVYEQLLAKDEWSLIEIIATGFSGHRRWEGQIRTMFGMAIGGSAVKTAA